MDPKKLLEQTLAEIEKERSRISMQETVAAEKSQRDAAIRCSFLNNWRPRILSVMQTLGEFWFPSGTRLVEVRNFWKTETKQVRTGGFSLDGPGTNYQHYEYHFVLNGGAIRRRSLGTVIDYEYKMGLDIRLHIHVSDCGTASGTIWWQLCRNDGLVDSGLPAWIPLSEEALEKLMARAVREGPFLFDGKFIG